MIPLLACSCWITSQKLLIISIPMFFLYLLHSTRNLIGNPPIFLSAKISYPPSLVCFVRFTSNPLWYSSSAIISSNFLGSTTCKRLWSSYMFLMRCLVLSITCISSFSSTSSYWKSSKLYSNADKSGIDAWSLFAISAIWVVGKFVISILGMFNWRGW